MFIRPAEPPLDAPLQARREIGQRLGDAGGGDTAGDVVSVQPAGGLPAWNEVHELQFSIAERGPRRRREILKGVDTHSAQGSPPIDHLQSGQLCAVLLLEIYAHRGRRPWCAPYPPAILSTFPTTGTGNVDAPGQRLRLLSIAFLIERQFNLGDPQRGTQALLQKAGEAVYGTQVKEPPHAGHHLYAVSRPDDLGPEENGE